MKYYIGIDGGGTKTNCILSDENLNIIHRKISGPSNFLTIGTDIVSETILSLINDCCAAQNISLEQILYVLLGTTGAGRDNDAKQLEQAIVETAKKRSLNLPKCKVESDARIALEGAFSGQSGSILIAGTGSIMFGKDKTGNIHRVGGFGRLIGDEGSGLSIGRKGLNVLAKYYDGRTAESKIVKMIMRKFDIGNQSELITKTYSNDFKIQDIAPLVIEAAEGGDEICNSILEEETNELLLHIAAMQRHLNEDEMKIVFIGGLITNGNLYSAMLNDKIKLYMPSVKIQKADYPPEVGAVILAKQYTR